jgi:predicted lysophospholipase L1 biosynthesis ABC-type transport system permease subunit
VQIAQNASDIASALSRIWRAWRDSGGTSGFLLQTLVATGAIVGIDEGVLAAAGAITVVAYISSCASCAVNAAGPAIWVTINACTGDDDLYVHDQLQLAANNAGVLPVG